jgi:hypothetical protein
MKLLAAFLSALFLPAAAGAAYLSSTFSEVSVDNLSPGTMYSLKKVANFPYNLTNKGSKPVTVGLEVIKPKPSSIRSGYEVIEDTSWVRLETPVITVLPGETKQVDVRIIIPADTRYLGRKYEAGIWAHTLEKDGGMPLSVGIESVLLIATGKAFDHAHKGGGYSIEPEQLDLGIVPVGKVFDVMRETGKTLKIYNDSDSLCEFGISLKGEPYIVLSENNVAVEPYSSKEIRMRVVVPDQKKCRGRGYSFILSVAPLGGEKHPSKLKISMSTEK